MGILGFSFFWGTLFFSNTFSKSTGQTNQIKGIGHFEMNFWYVLAYLKGIQDVGVFVSTVVSIFSIFRSNRQFDLSNCQSNCQVCQSYNAGLWSPPQRACTEKSKLNMI